MLALTRKSGESLVFTLPDGRQIHLELRRRGHDATRVIVDAPADVRVDRAEIAAAREATGAAPNHTEDPQ